MENGLPAIWAIRSFKSTVSGSLFTCSPSGRDSLLTVPYACSLLIWHDVGIIRGHCSFTLVPCRSLRLRNASPDNAAIGPLRRLGRVLGVGLMATKASQITKRFACSPRQHAICLAEGVRALPSKISASRASLLQLVGRGAKQHAETPLL